ncbi:MAG: sulfotransferase family 2 domain-containing protein [Bacteroidota bacterium]
MTQDLRPTTHDPQLVVVHVEKTAGTALIKALIEPNAPGYQRSASVTRYARHGWKAPVFIGHIPHGLHRFTRRPVRYATVLREPLERAVSWYYYIRGQESIDLWERHPLRSFVDRVTLVQFYRDERFENRQARFLAGLHYDRLYPTLRRSEAFRRRLLDAAKRNLEACAVFGVQDRFGDTVRAFEHTLGWTFVKQEKRWAAADKRRTLQDIDTLNPKVLPKLRESHDLDYELYFFAQQLFEDRYGWLAKEQVTP